MTTETPIHDTQYEEYEAPDGVYELEEEFDEPYRSISKAAVVALICAIFSLLGLVFPLLLSAALLAVICALKGLGNIRRYPDELTGTSTARAALTLGGLLLVGGTAWHTYVYITEVPEGYERISFAQLQPEDDRTLGTSNPDLPIELDGKRIFVKGYVHPGVADLGEIRQFILVPDMGTCCFGGQPKLTDMIEVEIVGDRGLRYSTRKRKLAGTFHVSKQIKPVAGGLQGGYYALEADYVR